MLRGELAGGAGAGRVGEDRFDGAAEVGSGLAAFQVDETGPGPCPASAPSSDLESPQTDPIGDLVIAKAIEGQQDDSGSLAEMRGGGGGVAEREQELVLPFRDSDFGRFTRHGESPPGVWGASEAG